MWLEESELDLQHGPLKKQKRKVKVLWRQLQRLIYLTFGNADIVVTGRPLIIRIASNRDCPGDLTAFATCRLPCHEVYIEGHVHIDQGFLQQGHCGYERWHG